MASPLNIGGLAAQNPYPYPGPRPKIIGIYGVQGCGKTTLINELKDILDPEHFLFFDGSEVLQAVIHPNDISGFDYYMPDTKLGYREAAIRYIQEKVRHSGKVGVVAGHAMLWNKEKNQEEEVWTEADLAVYTHILYMDLNPDFLWFRRNGDIDQNRGHLEIEQLEKWQSNEIKLLKGLCLKNSVLFMTLRDTATVYTQKAERVATILRDFRVHTEEHNRQLVINAVDQLCAFKEDLETMLVIDCDKTISPNDSSNIFWTTFYPEFLSERPLKDIFDSPQEYSYKAFRQAMFRYEESSDREYFDDQCDGLEGHLTLYPWFINLLNDIKTHGHVGVVLVTCGLKLLWEGVLKKAGLAEKVTLLGGERTDCKLAGKNYVITPELKANIVDRLKVHHGLYVWAIGDSPLDLPMFKRADRAVVVVGKESVRSKTMDEKLRDAIVTEGLIARQYFVDDTVTRRLDFDILPPIELGSKKTIAELTGKHTTFKVVIASEEGATKLLSTPARNSANRGPKLQTAHKEIGCHLVRSHLSEILGLEEYPIKHVLQETVTGYRIKDEENTLIIPLMRGGCPLARGMFKAMPKAKYHHAKKPEDIEFKHLEGYKTILIVDFVINTGQSVVEIITRVHELNKDARIIVLAGVIQADAITSEGKLHRLGKSIDFTVIGLRTSTTKFVGARATDTGNRLFNTTHLD